MTKYIVVGILFCQSAMLCRADEIKDAINASIKAIEEVSKTTDAKRKAEIFMEVKTSLTKTIDNIKSSKKIYADEELAPLYQNRGSCSYNLRDYEQALEDYKTASKLNPNKITPWLRQSLIKSSAPIDKLRNCKEALEAAESAFKAIKLYAAKEPLIPLDKFEHSMNVRDYNDECSIALSAAQAELGNFKEAILSIKDGPEKKIKEYLDLYRDGKAYRLPAKP